MTVEPSAEAGPAEMGAFLLVRHRQPPAEARATGALLDHFAACGFGEPRHITTPICEIFLYKKLSADNENLYLGNDGDFCLATGTLLYRELTGAPALAALHPDLASDQVAWDQLYGHFCVIQSSAGRLRLMTDRLGIYPVWQSDQAGVISSDYGALLAASPGAPVDPQCVYEYVFQGATYGSQSVVGGIDLLDPGSLTDLADPARSRPLPPVVRSAPEAGPIEQHVARNLANLRTYYQSIARCFGDQVDTALSGGYDSRLTLALLRDQGLRPRVHVYGAPGDPDVTVARRIAEGEGFALSQEDKSRFPSVDPARFAAVVARNFLAFQATPADGIFDPGADLATRRARCPQGELMLNGGGGEIFRNFFYLPDRALRLEQLLWSFYSQFDPGLCRAPFDEARYHANLGAKVKRTLGRPGDRLARHEVEFLYPAFRCRFWMGRNNGINNQLGPALTPFIDPNIVPAALAIPLGQKNAGRLEGRLIRALDPRLAAYDSDYGHGFAADPPAGRLAKDLVTRLRPPALRRYSYRLKRRDRRAWPEALGSDLLGRVIDLDFPYMNQFFTVERIADPAQFNRICTLEYLFQRIGATLPAPLELTLEDAEVYTKSR